MLQDTLYSKQKKWMKTFLQNWVTGNALLHFTHYNSNWKDLWKALSGAWVTERVTYSCHLIKRLSSAVTMIYTCTTLTHRLEKKNCTVFPAWAANEHKASVVHERISGHWNTRMSFQPMKMENNQIRNKEYIYFLFSNSSALNAGIQWSQCGSLKITWNLGLNSGRAHMRSCFSSPPQLRFF